MNLTDQIEFKSLDKIFGKIKSIEEKHSWIDYLIAPVIVAIIVLSVYAIKGVYPFGRNTIAYYDMSGSYIPIYTFVWDVFHGKSGLYLNWYSGLGVSMADVVGSFLFFPTNLFFLFTSRDGIIYSMSFFLIIKLMLCAFSMSFYYNKHYTGLSGSVCSGLLYAFSGFAIQYYTNIFYFDLVMLFPLVVWSFERLMKEHKYIFYIVLMFFSFFTNVQLVFMVGIYLIFKSYFIIKELPKETRGSSVRLFAISTIISAMMASFILFPSIIQTSKSIRANENMSFDYLNVMKNVYCQFRMQKYFIVYGTEICFGVLIIILIKGRTTINKYLSNIVMIVLLSLPLIHEGINRLWHAGSYKHFPVRFGYILTFECIILCSEFFKNEQLCTIKFLKIISKILGLASIPFLALIMFNYCSEFLDKGIDDMSPYHAYWLYYFTLSGAYLLIVLIDSEITRKFLLFFLVIIQSFCGCYGFIAPKAANYNENRNKSLFASIELEHALKGNNDFSKRIKSDPSEFESNHSIIFKHPSLSAWLYGVPASTTHFLQDKLGYDGKGSYLLDSGGTLFSDTLLKLDYAVSNKNPDSKTYKDTEYKNVYISKYDLPFGIIIETDEPESDSKKLDYQNDLFKWITGTNNKLINISSASEFVDYKENLSAKEEENIYRMFEENSTSIENEFSGKDDLSSKNYDSDNSIETLDNDESNFYKYKIKIPIDDESLLYMQANEEFNSSISMAINNKPVLFRSFIVQGVYQYPNVFRNGIVSLGTYSDEIVEIDLYTGSKIDNLSFGLLNLNLFKDGIDLIGKRQSFQVDFLKNGMILKGVANKSGKLFVPVGYSSNWSAKLNGVPIKVNSVMNESFVSIDVSEGEVLCEFSYLPEGLSSGIIISAIGGVLLLFMVWFGMRFKLLDKYVMVLDCVFLYGYYFVVYALLIGFYIVPIFLKLAL